MRAIRQLGSSSPLPRETHHVHAQYRKAHAVASAARGSAAGSSGGRGRTAEGELLRLMRLVAHAGGGVAHFQAECAGAADVRCIDRGGVGVAEEWGRAYELQRLLRVSWCLYPA